MKAKKVIVEDEASSEIYADYMSKIIQQIPNSENLSLLLGTSSAQASFYFKNAKNEINASLYNNKLARRIVGRGAQFGVNQVDLTLDIFTSNYLDVFQKIEYHLSTADQAEQERLYSLTFELVDELTEIWNQWLIRYSIKDIPPLDPRDKNKALIEMTSTLQTTWVSEDFIKVLESDPSYPYTHLDQFNIIFARIPETVPNYMIELMVKIYSTEGEAGVLTSQVALATQTLNGVRRNIINPKNGPDGNGGLLLTDSEITIPGMTYSPQEASNIENQLAKDPPHPVLQYVSYESKIKPSEHNLLVTLKNSKTIKIHAINFFSMKILAENEHDDEKFASIFAEPYAGTQFNVDIKVLNPVYHPPFEFTPMNYNPYTKDGWMANDVIKEAISNGRDEEITGYIFTSAPNFNFAEGGDFGYINSIIFSQFIHLKLEFIDCEPEKVKNYFIQHQDSPIRFLNIPISGIFENQKYYHSIIEESINTLKIEISPKPPGFIPPSTGNIEASLCSLTAVNVVYPIAM